MTGRPETILIIDDDQLFRAGLQHALESLDCLVQACGDLESAQSNLSSFSPSWVFADRRIRGEPIDRRLLETIRQTSPGSHVVIYTRIDELRPADVCALLKMGAVRVLDRSEIADSPEKILRECGELREISSALDELTRGRSDLVTALVGSDVGVTMIDRQFNCWFANNRQHELVDGRCMGGFCWHLFHGQPPEAGPCWGCGTRDVFDESFNRGTPIHRVILTHLRDDRVHWLGCPPQHRFNAAKVARGEEHENQSLNCHRRVVISLAASTADANHSLLPKEETVDLLKRGSLGGCFWSSALRQFRNLFRLFKRGPKLGNTSQAGSSSPQETVGHVELRNMKRSVSGIQCLVDTGAEISLFQAKIGKELGLAPGGGTVRSMRIEGFSGHVDKGLWSEQIVYIGIGPDPIPVPVLFPVRAVRPDKRLEYRWRHKGLDENILGMESVLSKRMLCFTPDYLFVFENHP
jgi:ActR/RegA family two-component response regulator